MVKKISKRTAFLFSIVVVGMFGLIQNVLKDNFTKSESSFRKEKITLTPEIIEKAYADAVVPPPADGCDGCGDGSNGF